MANGLIKEIYRLCARRGISLFVEWVPRQFSQVADDFSQSEELRAWSMHARVFQAAQRHFGVRCTVDRFASVENRLLARFNVKWFAGWREGRRAEAVDALAQPWGGLEMNWLNPPFGMIGQVLGYASQQRAQGLLVVPTAAAWRYSAWWSRIFAAERPRWLIGSVDCAVLAAQLQLAPAAVFLQGGRPVERALSAAVVRFDFRRCSL